MSHSNKIHFVSEIFNSFIKCYLKITTCRDYKKQNSFFISGQVLAKIITIRYLLNEKKMELIRNLLRKKIKQTKLMKLPFPSQ